MTGSLVRVGLGKRTDDRHEAGNDGRRNDESGLGRCFVRNMTGKGDGNDTYDDRMKLITSLTVSGKQLPVV